MAPPRAVALLAALLLGLAGAGCGGAEEAEQPPAPPPAPETGPADEPDEDEAENGEPADEPGPLELEAETLAGGLEVPWSLAFTPEGDILVTERPGRVRLVQDGELVEEPVAQVEVEAAGEGGLHGVALHPDFPEQPHVYLYYTHPAGENRVSRFQAAEEGPAGLSLAGEQVIVDGIPAAQIHNGGRIAFGPDGMLYVTTGEAGRPALSADRDSLGGKILRVDLDGAVPDDNPFDSPVWAYGIRNAQGIAWDGEGTLYASDHGPSGELGLCCLDELNLVERGEFYGWPFRAGTVDAASPGDVGAEPPPDEAVDPIAASGTDETWAPGGIALHEPEGARASVLMAELAGQRLSRHVLSPDGRDVVTEEVALDGVGRLRDVVRGPDECFYALTSNRDGRGSPQEGDDRILRLCPRAE